MHGGREVSEAIRKGLEIAKRNLSDVPVVAGEAATRRQILAYSVVLFAVSLGWLPAKSAMTQGWDWRQLVLPVLTLVIYDFGYVARMTRASMVEVMDTPYIRAAIIKGMPRRRVIFRHAVRNALLAPITILGRAQSLPRPEMAAFHHRQRTGRGSFVTRDDVESVMAVFTPDGSYSAFGDTYPLADFPTLVDLLRYRAERKRGQGQSHGAVSVIMSPYVKRHG